MGRYESEVYSSYPRHSPCLYSFSSVRTRGPGNRLFGFAGFPHRSARFRLKESGVWRCSSGDLWSIPPDFNLPVHRTVEYKNLVHPERIMVAQSLSPTGKKRRPRYRLRLLVMIKDTQRNVMGNDLRSVGSLPILLPMSQAEPGPKMARSSHPTKGIGGTHRIWLS